MKEVNIYVETSIRGPGIKKGKGIYILETKVNEKTATLNGDIELEASENAGELQTILKALGRLNQPCEVNIYTDSQIIETGVTQWLEGWEKNGWKNAKGKEVANKDLWQQFRTELNKHTIVIFTRCEHEYKSWMQSEVRKHG